MIRTPARIDDVHFDGLFTIRERARVEVSGVKSAIAGVDFFITRWIIWLYQGLISG